MEPEKCHWWFGEFILYHSNNADCISNIKHTTYFNEIRKWFERNPTVYFNPMTEQWGFWCSVILGCRMNSWSSLFLLWVFFYAYFVFWGFYVVFSLGYVKFPVVKMSTWKQMFQEGSSMKLLSYSASRIPTCVTPTSNYPAPLPRLRA